MPRPLTDACAAVLPIVFVAMAFSIFKHHTKAGWNSWRAVQNMTAGQSAFGAVKFSGAAKAKRHRPYPWYPRFIGISTFLRPAPAQDLLLCAKHLFVAAMMAGVHPGLPRIGKSGHDGGASAFGADEVFRGSKSKAPPLSPGRRTFAPCL